MAAATTVDEYKILSKSIKSVRDRVINLSDCLPEPLTPEEFKSAIVSSVIKNGQFYELTDEDKVRIRQLGEEKFHSWESIYGFSPRFSIQREAHLKGGLFHTDLNIKKGRITEIDFSGDFFSAVDLESLKKALTGCRYQKQDVQNIIEKTVGNGIYEISPKDMANVIVV